MSEGCTTRLLPDDPSDSDAFGSLDRVAEAIAELVCSNSGGKALALKGAWGSGKSTAIRLLSAALAARSQSGRPSAELFVFDVWAHQGDPLRRSFLQELVDFLVRKKWIVEKDWKRKLEELARRREDTDITSEPLLTIAGRLMAASALLIAPGAVIYSKVTTEGRPFGNPLSVIALLMTVAPLLVGSVTWCVWRPTWRFWKRDFWTRHRPPYEDESLASLFISKTREMSRTRTIRTPDPTSLEFREVFFDALGGALGNTDRRIILVMDNLDRLDPKDALAIWGTMRIFLEVDRIRPPWTDRLWLLIPFDPTALDRIWGEPSDGNAALVTAYSEKIFQVSFFVSPPVHSDWRSFFMRQMALAFPSHKPEGDFEIVYRLFRIRATRRDVPPTPRDIKLFVNGLVAVHRQWNDEIPLASQALYVLNADEIRKAPIVIAKDSFLDDRSMVVVGTLEWQKHLAALHFNVSIGKALQVLVGPRLERALAEGDGGALRELEVVPGFWVLVEQCLDQSHSSWTQGEPSAFAMSALALDSLDSAGEPDGAFVWQLLQMGAERVESWPVLNEKTGEGLARIVRRAPPDSARPTADRIVKGLARTTPTAGDKPSKDSGVTPEQWVAGAIPLVRVLLAEGYSDLLGTSFRVPGDASVYVQVMLSVTSRLLTEASLAGYFVPSISGREIVAKLAEYADGGQLTRQHVTTLPLMVQIGSKWQWDGLLESLERRLQAGSGASPEEVALGLEAIFILRRIDRSTERAHAILAALAKGGHMLSHLHQAHTADEMETAGANCVLIMLVHLPSASVSVHVGNSNAGLQLYNQILQKPEGYTEHVEALSDLVVERGAAGDILRVHAVSPNTRSLVSAVMQLIVDRDDVDDVLSPALLIEHFDSVVACVPESQVGKLLQTLIQKKDLLGEICKTLFSAEQSELYEKVLIAASENVTADYTSFLASGARSLTQEFWSEELSEEGPTLALLFALLERGVDVGLTTAFSDALRVHGGAVLAGEDSPSELKEPWGKLPDALTPELRETFWRDIRDDLLAASEKPVLPIIGLYGEGLIQSGVLEDKADDVVRRLFRGILDRLEILELQWLSKVIDQQPRVLERSKPASRDTLGRRVRDALKREDLSNEATSILNALSRTVGVADDEGEGAQDGE